MSVKIFIHPAHGILSAFQRQQPILDPGVLANCISNLTTSTWNLNKGHRHTRHQEDIRKNQESRKKTNKNLTKLHSNGGTREIFEK